MADHFVRHVVLAVGLLLATSACSSSDESAEDEVSSTADTATSSTTEASTTTTTEANTTTLSELALAEAEVEEVVVNWWTFLLDTSEEGSAEERREFTTGLLRQRNIELLAGTAEDGLVIRNLEPSPIQVTDVAVNLDDGTAEATACLADGSIVVDAGTEEIVQAGDPDNTAISTLQLQLTDGQWKISEFLPSVATQNPISCEIQP